ncbi:MAG: prolyl oligopeptidase family serine peptidase, partial [Holophagales bacterium]|nr:prolyl oligopeptidase family serine peptidase [Holophagales bacterium]
PDVRVYGLDGRLERRVEMPMLGMPWSGFPGQRQDTTAYFGLSTVFDPGSIYRLDPRTGKVSSVVESDTPLDPERFVIRQVSYPSDDGVRIPMFLAHRRDLDLERPHPVFLYGYGAYGWVAFPWFQPHVAVWMEAGGIYALPGIRGGGEHGDAWHRAGRGRNKGRAIADYLAAAEWLVREGLSEPSRLVANGGSASGVLAAAAVLQRPQLFGAAVVDIPALDMLRHEHSPRGGYWTPEFGTVEDPDDFAALLSYSPYQALGSGGCPPPILLTVGERDEITPPWHGYKFAARAQSLSPPPAGPESGAGACPNEVLLQVVWGEGHGFGTTPEQSVRTWARQLAFLDRVLREADSGGLREVSELPRDGHLSPSKRGDIGWQGE